MSYENTHIKKIKEPVAAIDIGTTKIVAALGQQMENGRIKILGLGESESHGVKRGVVQNIDETVKAIKEAVGIAELHSGLKFEHVVVGIAGQHIKSLTNRGIINIDSEDSTILQKHLDELIENMHHVSLNPGEEILHIIPQSFTIDNETGITSNVVGMFGKRLEGNFHIVVGQTTSAKNIEKCIIRAGLILDSMVLEPLASADAVLSDEEKEAGVAMVDIGGGTTDMALFHDNIIRQTLVVPLGGSVITNDIKEGLRIIARDAEILKVTHGQALAEMAPKNEFITLRGFSEQTNKKISKNQLAMIIQARMEEIIAVIEYELKDSGYFDRLGAGIVLTGGGAMLKNLAQLFRFKIGIDVRIAQPNEMFSLQNDNLAHPKFSTAIGLVLKGIEYYEKNGISKKEEKSKQEETNFTNEDSFGGVINKFKRLVSNMFDMGDSDSSM